MLSSFPYTLLCAEGRASARPAVRIPCDRSPLQNVKFSLIWPVFRMRHETVTNGIAANIFPFVVIAFAGSKLAVPVVTLPARAAGLPHAAGHKRFPKSHPALQRRSVQTIRRTEKVNVVSHDHITPDQPCRCRTPGRDNLIMSQSRRENFASFGGACCNENNDGPVVHLKRCEMNRMFSPRRDVLPHVLSFRFRTCRSMSLRRLPLKISLRRMRRSHGDGRGSIPIRLVISTASSSAAVAWNPETFGCRPVLAHSINAAS